MAANPVAAPTLSPEASDPEVQDNIGLGAPDVEAFEDALGSSEQARADIHVQTVCLLILAFVAGGVALYLLRPVLVPFVLALFFAACLKPLIRFQQRVLRSPQPVAVAGSVLLAIALVVLIGIPLASSLNSMWPVLTQQFDQFIAKAEQALPLERFGFKPSFKMPDQATNWVVSVVGSAVGEVTGLASGVILVIIFTLFILLGRRGNAPRSDGMLAEIEVRVQRYISQMVLLSAVTGIGVGTVLAVLNIRFAVAFGFLAFLLNFIPTIGSIVATLLPLPIILLSPDLGPAAKILGMAIPAAMQIYLGNAVQPRVLGNALDLHPIVILISLIFWGMIWGVPGAFLATPMTAVLRIVLEKIPATRPLAELLAGRLDAVFS